MKTRTMRYVREARYHCDVVDMQAQPPRVIAGYSYPLPVRNGQVDEITGLSANERMNCIVRNHRSHTTINGICLDCLTQFHKHV